MPCSVMYACGTRSRDIDLAAAFWTLTFWKGHFKMHFVVKNNVQRRDKKIGIEIFSYFLVFFTIWPLKKGGPIKPPPPYLRGLMNLMPRISI
jgi:hypothetical protein